MRAIEVDKGQVVDIPLGYTVGTRAQAHDADPALGVVADAYGVTTRDIPGCQGYLVGVWVDVDPDDVDPRGKVLGFSRFTRTIPRGSRVALVHHQRVGRKRPDWLIIAFEPPTQ